MLDLTTERDAHIDQRLRSSHMIWLSTVHIEGYSHSTAQIPARIGEILVMKV